MRMPLAHAHTLPLRAPGEQFFGVGVVDKPHGVGHVCGNNCDTVVMMSLVDMMLPYGGSLLLFGGEFGLPVRGPADQPLRFGDITGELYRKNVI